MTSKNEFERDFQFYMALAQLQIKETVREILAEIKEKEVPYVYL